MRCLLDTHTFAWAVGAPTQLGERARTLIADSSVSLLVSPASIWEMSIKHALGKWPEVAPFLDDKLFVQLRSRLGLTELPVRIPHTRLAGQFSVSHKDPFDRLLVAQAVLEGLTLLSKDTALDAFPTTRIW